MRPATVNFTIRNNEAWADGFTLEFEGGAPFTFASYTPLRLQLKGDPQETVPRLDLTVGAGLTVDGDGGLSIAVPLADLQYLLGDYCYDITGTDAGAPVVLAIGRVRILQGVTYTWP